MPSRSLERIVLTGFMGSGKTTVGRLLAARLGWSFVDLDDAVAERVGLSVPDIFSTHGEARFRQEEALALADCLRRSGLVLALGGGAPEQEANRSSLRQAQNTAVIYLQGPFETLQARCLAQGVEPGAVVRPVLADPGIALQRFALRAPLYAEVATHALNTLGHPPAALVEHLHATLGFNKQS